MLIELKLFCFYLLPYFRLLYAVQVDHGRLVPAWWAAALLHSLARVTLGGNVCHMGNVMNLIWYMGNVINLI